MEREEWKTRGREKLYCSNPCRHESRRGGKWTPHNRISDEILLSDLRNLIMELGRLPMTNDIHSRWPNRQIAYTRRFSGLRKSMERCGIDLGPYTKSPPQKIPSIPRRYTNEQLIEELQRVATFL